MVWVWLTETRNHRRMEHYSCGQEDARGTKYKGWWFPTYIAYIIYVRFILPFVIYLASSKIRPTLTRNPDVPFICMFFKMQRCLDLQSAPYEVATFLRHKATGRGTWRVYGGPSAMASFLHPQRSLPVADLDVGGAAVERFAPWTMGDGTLWQSNRMWTTQCHL